MRQPRWSPQAWLPIFGKQRDSRVLSSPRGRLQKNWRVWRRSHARARVVTGTPLQEEDLNYGQSGLSKAFIIGQIVIPPATRGIRMKRLRAGGGGGWPGCLPQPASSDTR